MKELLDKELCYHCGDACTVEFVQYDSKTFCCKGCVSVYQILNKHQLLDYYCFNENPGVKLSEEEASEKFKFLEIESIVADIVKFKNAQQTQVELYLPQIHCSSCLWLLEHLHQFHEGIIHTKVNFTTKTIHITFQHDLISLNSLVILLSSIGYEPLIDIYQPEQKRLNAKYSSKHAYLKIGIAGFCFSNIMLISFPEYLGLDPADNPSLNTFFKWTCLLLSLPVVFYSAREFFENSYYSFKQRYLNIDVPIALAITVTFLRSVYEVVTDTGVGFFDSMTGIVFFMLLGRTLQNRSYTTLSFNKNMQSYFPLAVTRVQGENSEVIKVQEVVEDDVLYIHTQEVIPTDCLLSKGSALIDYSFITGESIPEQVEKGAIIYAGGKNVGSSIEVVVLKPFSDNSFTQLWNNNKFEKEAFEKEAMTTIISKYFSLVVILISLSAFIYWQFANPMHAWNAATAVLIIACPCALLLTASFTNGYLLELLSKHGIYFKNAEIVEKMAKCSHISFDKTGTLTDTSTAEIHVYQYDLSPSELDLVLSTMQQSIHPLSKAIVKHYSASNRYLSTRVDVQEVVGKGLSFEHDGSVWKIGSRPFVTNTAVEKSATEVLISKDNLVKAIYTFEVSLIPGVPRMLNELSTTHSLSLISGDNPAAHQAMKEIFPANTQMYFEYTPEEKLNHIKKLQAGGEHVMMVGDGINDAAALKQSDVGVTLVKQSFAFTPTSDVIMEDKHVQHLHKIIQLNKATMKLIWLGFSYSLIFNIIGIYFSVTGNLSPLIAAILMPSSSLGIILIAFIGMNFLSKKYLSEERVDTVMIKADKNHVLT